MIGRLGQSGLLVLLVLSRERKVTGGIQARESRDNPMLNAFCRVAPSVRFKALAIFRAGILFRAADFSSRTSVAVHERRFEFLAI